MTQQTRDINKKRFETGDAPSQSDYTDLIDSSLSLADASAQTVTAPIILTSTLGVGAKMSAASVSADEVRGSAASFTQAGLVTLLVSATASIGTAMIGVTRTDTLTVAATASIGVAHLNQIVINTEATAAVSAPASAARFVEVLVSGVPFWLPLYSQ